MSRRTNIVWVMVLIAVLLTTGVMPRAALAQRASVPKPPPDRLALAENEVKQLLLLMDTDKNGKISKHEYMRFMESEFERLDRKSNGQLDVKELTESKLRVSHFAAVGK
jgi:Ca2+-binding EF-hand superfamily protein